MVHDVGWIITHLCVVHVSQGKRGVPRVHAYVYGRILGDGDRIRVVQNRPVWHV
jgi:hypothetical protein